MSNDDPFTATPKFLHNLSFAKIVVSQPQQGFHQELPEVEELAVEDPTPSEPPEPLWDSMVILNEESDEFRFNNVYLNSQTRTLTVCAPPYLIVESIDEASIRNLAVHSDIFPLDKVATYEIDESLIPTCKHYVPSAQNIEAGALQIDNYYFTKDPSIAACQCPGLMRRLEPPFTPCDFSPLSQPKCREYSPVQSTVVATLVVDGAAVKHVFKGSVSFGIPVYSFTSDLKETYTKEEIDTLLEEEVTTLKEQGMQATILPSFEELETVPYIKSVLFDQQ